MVLRLHFFMLQQARFCQCFVVFQPIQVLIGQSKVGQNLVEQNYQSEKFLVTSKDFGHFCPTNNYACFEISKYHQISILRDSDKIFSREKLKKNVSQTDNQYFIFQSQCCIPHQFQICHLLEFHLSKVFFFPFWIHNLTISLTLFERFTYRRCFPLFTLSVLPLHCRCSSLPTIR